MCETELLVDLFYYGKGSDTAFQHTLQPERLLLHELGEQLNGVYGQLIE